MKPDDWLKKSTADQVAELERLYRRPPPALMIVNNTDRPMYVSFHDVTRFTGLRRELDNIQRELESFLSEDQEDGA